MTTFVLVLNIIPANEIDRGEIDAFKEKPPLFSLERMSYCYCKIAFCVYRLEETRLDQCGVAFSTKFVEQEI